MSHQRQTDQSAHAAARGFDRPRVKTQCGVTMIEVMVTTAISAVILGVAAPSFVDSMQFNRISSHAKAMSGLLRDARTEAVKRNVPVLVCPTTEQNLAQNPAPCEFDPKKSEPWATQPVIVCYDADAPPNQCDSSTANAPNPIRVRGARSLDDTSVRLSGPATQVRFNGLGAVNNAVSYELAAGSFKFKVEVDASGVVRVSCKNEKLPDDSRCRAEGAAPYKDAGEAN